VDEKHNLEEEKDEFRGTTPVWKVDAGGRSFMVCGTVLMKACRAEAMAFQSGIKYVEAKLLPCGRHGRTLSPMTP
jgi:hypothetical protein